MSDIFVSYASQDRNRVRPLVDALEKQGWSVWWDRSILAGQEWDEAIETELHKARCVVVLWSLTSVGSKWVKNEARGANKRGVLIPARIDSVEPPLEFNNVQTADLSQWQGGASTADEFHHFTRAVSRILSEPHSVAPSVKPNGAGRTSRMWQYAAALTIAIGVLIFGAKLMNNKERATLESNPRPADRQQIENKVDKAATETAAPKPVRRPPAVSVTVQLYNGASKPDTFVDGRPATIQEYSSGLATFRLSPGVHEVRAEYPNRTCKATITVPSQIPADAECSLK